MDLSGWLVPVANEDEEAVLLAVSGPHSGRVFLWPNLEGEIEEGDLEPVAESFPEYLAADQTG